MSETWEPIGTTLTPKSRLLSILDTPEGFRVLVEDHSGFIYAVRAEPAFYRRCSVLFDAEYTDSSPLSLADAETVLFQVLGSELLAELSRTATAFGCKPPNGLLKHFALCFESGDRIDIVCERVQVRAAFHREEGANGVSL